MEINKTSKNQAIEETDKAISDAIKDSSDEGAAIDNYKVYENLKINATEMEENSKHPNRLSDWSIKRMLASIVIKLGKTIGLSVGHDTKLSLDTSSITSISHSHHIKANRIHLDCDELIINGHKLNNRIFELADFRELPDKEGSVIGDLLMKGTVLVKTWEPNLSRYVLVRRDIYMPIFGKLTTTPEIAEGLKLNDPTKLITDFAPFTQSMLKGSSPITEASVKKEMDKIDPEVQKLADNNILGFDVKKYDTFEDFDKELTAKYEEVKKDIEALKEKGVFGLEEKLKEVEETYKTLREKGQKDFEKV